jgi:hypothetical protein
VTTIADAILYLRQTLNAPAPPAGTLADLDKALTGVQS